MFGKFRSRHLARAATSGEERSGRSFLSVLFISRTRSYGSPCTLQVKFHCKALALTLLLDHNLMADAYSDWSCAPLVSTLPLHLPHLPRFGKRGWWGYSKMLPVIKLGRLEGCISRVETGRYCRLLISKPGIFWVFVRDSFFVVVWF